MKKIHIIITLLFAVQLCMAQKDTTSTGNKIEIGLNLGYGMPLAGGDFGKYYTGSGIYDLSLDYKINSAFSLGLGLGYSMFQLSKLNNYVADKADRLIVNSPPYSDLVGGSIRVIAIDLDLKKTFKVNSKTRIDVFAGPGFSFLEKSPVDGTDSDGTYQILEHYVHEKPIGLNLGSDINYSLCNYFALDFSLKYKMMFTSFVNEKPLGILALQVGGILKF